jgi:hypothetical protein
MLTSEGQTWMPSRMLCNEGSEQADIDSRDTFSLVEYIATTLKTIIEKPACW